MNLLIGNWSPEKGRKGLSIYEYNWSTEKFHLSKILNLMLALAI